MKKLIICVCFVALTGCASEGRNVLDRIEFGEDEYGCARVQGNASASANPFAGADATFLIVKKKDNPNPESDEKAPEC